ncbi:MULTISPECIES: LysR family transcriptional regulator [unclassified Mesorhizobium]|uniref:LysR family transcriptional regulator n=1 Tax=unclassified Mesorhizobium TaxID=325217 RepID=UPI0024174A5B|nr:MULTISPECIES: LysR family transcriptional regulator [unclassified Mesorhizobium]WFP65578.1 LysR family transcriptional regulator [Mesorhizobium sp. WSM4904]WFP78843.1 LysR family transcriptional regulator [Mesorhizobium sp. WSM4906]
MTFSLKQVRYFIAAAETGQVSRAAIQLNVSQSAVTTAIRQLEDLIGITLLNRTSLGVTLTRDGEQFLRRGRDIIATVEQALHLQRDGEREVAGEVRLGTTTIVTGYFLAPLLARFHYVYPDVRLILEELSRQAAEKAVLDGRFDLALTMTQDAQQDGGLNYKLLHRSSRRLWLSANHALLAKESVTLGEVAQEPYIALTVDDAWDNALRYWETEPVKPKVVYRTDSVEAIRTMVASGLGVSILSDIIYRRWSLDGQRVETRDLQNNVPTLDVSIVTATQRKLSPAAKTFTTFIQRIVSSPQLPQ